MIQKKGGSIIHHQLLTHLSHYLYVLNTPTGACNFSRLAVTKFCVVNTTGNPIFHQVFSSKTG